MCARANRVGVATLALALVAACSEPLIPPHPPGLLSLELSPESVRLAPGDTLRMRADARDSTGQSQPAGTLRWVTRNPGLVTVDPLGLVRALPLPDGVTEADTWIDVFGRQLRDSARIIVALAGSSGVPRMGINLDMVNDWSTEWPFLNLMKASRRWVSNRTGAAWGQGGPLHLTGDNWVASLQPGQWATTLVFTDPAGHQPGGEYVLLWDGDGDVSFDNNPAVTVLSTAAGRVTARIAPRSAALLSVRRTNAANPVRNLRLVPAEHESRHATQIFNPRFLNVIRPFGVIRFMNWQAMNYEPPSEWANRSRPEFATWAGPWGVPVEIMVALANELRADAWFSMPHNASDEYVRQFATLVRNQLGPQRKVYVEYSNEIWNGLFPQSRWVGDRGVAAGLSSDRFLATMRFQSQRSVEMFAIWRSVFGADSQRVVRVLASQAANAWTAEQLLNWRDAYRSTDAIAIAPYFGGRYGGRNGAEEAGMSETQLLDLLATEIETTTLGYFRANRTVAERYAVRLTTYEGGQHLVSADVQPQYEAAVTRLFTGVNRHPRMGELYRRYFELWYENGGDLFMPFVAVASWGRYGSWGALEYVHQDPASSPKYQALLEAAARFGR